MVLAVALEDEDAVRCKVVAHIKSSKALAFLILLAATVVSPMAIDKKEVGQHHDALIEFYVLGDREPGSHMDCVRISGNASVRRCSLSEFEQFGRSSSLVGWSEVDGVEH
ncbi:hypothetical protein GUJ93_ZPchr0005g14792 [Zizania palustris]|uniref:Uncharacterized protein n=1 Tax=Zizania palustris TaxID=103762 RepID=A0A8J5W185_ZIZPA|nr:hypothetical protein GUJ93_ZPchr0005g14792 [Zizania palustris]